MVVLRVDQAASGQVICEPAKIPPRSQPNSPFHRDKNSINDALLIEAYADFIKEDDKPGRRFAFVMHNYRDFSEPAGNQKHPHPDFAALFSARKSRCYGRTLSL
jgi:hypothetical protein